MVRIFCAAFAAFLFYMVPILALAQSSASILYADDAIRIPWPSELERFPCSSELQAKAGISCVQLGTDGSLGAVFLTVNDGYALGSEQALEQHLKSSEEALTGIPNIHVMQSRVLKTEPMLGLMEILRKDGGLPGISALSQPPVRQTAFLVPTGHRLAQVFIYLPLDGDEAARIYQTLFDTMVAGIAVYQAPELPADRSGKPQGGVLQILPKALMLGGVIALVGIVIIRLRRRRTV